MFIFAEIRTFVRQKRQKISTRDPRVLALFAKKRLRVLKISTRDPRVLICDEKLLTKLVKKGIKEVIKRVARKEVGGGKKCP